MSNTSPNSNDQPRLNHVQCISPQGLHQMGYWEWGDSANPKVVLCVHGLTRQGRDFDWLARSLSAHYRVVCPDVVGRGQSSRLADAAGYAVPQYVADMVSLIARLGVKQVDWVGTSMGGLIAMGLAGLAGSPIRRLVLNDIGPSLDWVGLARIGSYVGQPVQWPNLEAATDSQQVTAAPFGPHTREQWREITRHQIVPAPSGGFVYHYDPKIAVPFKGMTQAMAVAGESFAWQNWDRISCPTLVLRGAQSDLLSRETVAAMGQRGPKAKGLEFEGVGHAPMLIAQDQQRAVMDFLLERTH